MKNYETKITAVEKFSPTETCFPTVGQAEERGNQLLSYKSPDVTAPKYTGFNTMEINYFIEYTVKRFGVAE